MQVHNGGRYRWVRVHGGDAKFRDCHDSRGQISRSHWCETTSRLRMRISARQAFRIVQCAAAGSVSQAISLGAHCSFQWCVHLNLWHRGPEYGDRIWDRVDGNEHPLGLLQLPAEQANPTPRSSPIHLWLLLFQHTFTGEVTVAVVELEAVARQWSLRSPHDSNANIDLCHKSHCRSSNTRSSCRLPGHLPGTLIFQPMFGRMPVQRKRSTVSDRRVSS
jgi:hypothetical protein